MFIPRIQFNGVTSPSATDFSGWGPTYTDGGTNTNEVFNVIPGQTVTVGLRSLNYYSGALYTNYPCYYYAWIDYNNDGNFTTDEQVIGYNYNNGTGSFQYRSSTAFTNAPSFVIPTSVVPGPKRFRLTAVYSTTSSTYWGPCNTNIYYKDFKDFQLNIGYNNDAALTIVKTQTPAPFAPGDNTIQAVVTNNGVNSLTSVQVNWSLNGVTQSPVMVNTTLASGASTTVNLGTFTFPQVGSMSVQAWTSSPNGTTDGNTSNDMSATVLLGAALNGNYTAGGSNPDFTSPAQAAAQLTAGGTLGPVTINVRPGTYTENIYLANMPGNINTRPVVFQSEDGNKNTCVIQFSGLTSPAGNTGDLRNTTSVGGTPTLRLNNADWVTFKNLTLASLNVGYNTIVELCGPANTVTATTQAYGGSDYVTFDNVNFNAQVNTGVLSTMNDAVIVGVNGSLNNNLTINNCVFNNGVAQMYMNRNFFTIGGVFLAFSTTPPPAQNAWVITNNTFNNYGAFPLRIDNTADANITGNTWTSTNMITQRGIMFTQNEGNFRFNKNRVSTPVASGLEVLFFGTRTNSGTRGLVSNNFVSVPTGSAGWAINNSSALNMDYMHNTIYTNASGTTNAAAINITGSGVTPVNNIIYNAAGGPAVNITAGAVTGMNYNLLYSTGATLGYWSGFGYADLASWRSATAQDANSSSAAVTFNNVATGDYRLTTVDANLFGYGSTSNGTYGLGIRSRVPDDFYGASRSRTEVYMGAHQIVPVITINPMPPSEMSGCANQTMNISANASVTYNANMSFQWMRNGAPLIDGVNGISGSKTATLTIANTQPSLHGGDYVLSITASGGADPSVTNIIAVTINAPIQIVRQPESRILCRNNETSLSVVANGTILGYQWQKDGQAITGATNPIYVLKNADYVVSGRYRCIMTGTCGTTTVTTDDAVVNVASPTIIARDPGQKGAAEGSTGYLDVDVNAAALAPGYSPQFQWYKGTTMLTDNGRITGTSTAQLTIRNMALADITADYY
ncbi:MAG: hypothetical protein JNJ85_07625, partial [Candidatus Kapabacteria bacterium]|nr:hypothetical protein [Candidatus Kapabacteria bacterium]